MSWNEVLKITCLQIKKPSSSISRKLLLCAKQRVTLTQFHASAWQGFKCVKKLTSTRFFKHSSQPRSYISEGESTIDTRSNGICLITNDYNKRNSATIFTMIGLNQDWVGTWNSSLSRDFEMKKLPKKLLRQWGSNLRPCALLLSVQSDSSGLGSSSISAPC